MIEWILQMWIGFMLGVVFMAWILGATKPDPRDKEEWVRMQELRDMEDDPYDDKIMFRSQERNGNAK